MRSCLRALTAEDPRLARSGARAIRPHRPPGAILEPAVGPFKEFDALPALGPNRGENVRRMRLLATTQPFSLQRDIVQRNWRRSDRSRDWLPKASRPIMSRPMNLLQTSFRTL